MLHRNVCVTLHILKTACVQGKVVQALKCAQKHQLTSVDPEAFLSKAAETGVCHVFCWAQQSVSRLQPWHSISCCFAAVLCSAAAKVGWFDGA